MPYFVFLAKPHFVEVMIGIIARDAVVRAKQRRIHIFHEVARERRQHRRAHGTEDLCSSARSPHMKNEKSTMDSAGMDSASARGEGGATTINNGTSQSFGG